MNRGRYSSVCNRPMVCWRAFRNSIPWDGVAIICMLAGTALTGLWTGWAAASHGATLIATGALAFVRRRKEPAEMPVESDEVGNTNPDIPPTIDQMIRFLPEVRRQILATTTFILIVSSLVLGTAIIGKLYSTASDTQIERLSAIAQAWAGHAESIYEASLTSGHGEVSEAGRSRLLQQLIEVRDRSLNFGKTGELMLARREGDAIVYLLPRHRQLPDSVVTIISDPPLSVPMLSELAEPMRRALKGQAGHLIGLDYDANEVLAAYEPIRGLGWGLVAKIRMSEIRGPFVHAATYTLMIILIIGVLGAMVIHASIRPMLRHLEERTTTLAKTYSALAQVKVDHNREEADGRRSGVLLDGINRIMGEALTFDSEADMADCLLSVAEGLTGSAFGFIDKIGEDGRFDVVAISDTRWSDWHALFADSLVSHTRVPIARSTIR